jgi:hypothetical protein
MRDGAILLFGGGVALLDIHCVHIIRGKYTMPAKGSVNYPKVNIGDKFVNWEVLSLEFRKQGKSYQVFCKCLKCNKTEAWVRYGRLNTGDSTQCRYCASADNGRINAEKRKSERVLYRPELVGQIFNSWEIISPDIEYRGQAPYVLCRCACGRTEQMNSIGNIKRVHKACKLCKADNTSKVRKTHGMSGTRIYRTWAGMKDRCHNPNSYTRKYHGDLGIQVCQEWLDSFEAFYEWAMANGYRDDLFIDRINGDGFYCPENCRWVTQPENARNMIRRKEGANYKGVSKYEGKEGVSWYVRITKDNKTYSERGFATEEEAALAYNEMAIDLFGEFACLNIIEDSPDQ